MHYLPENGVHIYAPNLPESKIHHLSVSELCDYLTKLIHIDGAFGNNSPATISLNITAHQVEIVIQLSDKGVVFDDTRYVLDSDKNYVLIRYRYRIRKLSPEGEELIVREADFKSEYREIAPGVFFLSKGSARWKNSGKNFKEVEVGNGVVIRQPKESEQNIVINSIETGNFQVDKTLFDIHYWPPIKPGIKVDDYRVDPHRMFIYDNNSFDEEDFGKNVNDKAEVNLTPEADDKEQDSGQSVKQSAPGGGTPALVTSPDSSEYIALPAYSAIANPKIRKQLEITPLQEKKLREISAAFMTEVQKLDQEVRNVPPKESQAKTEAIKQKWDELRTNGQKQIEEVITPQQLDACKKLVFPVMAFAMLQDPQVLKNIDITPEQKEKLRQLHKDMSQSMDRESQDRTDRSLALLSREQLEKLRVEVERQYRESHEPKTAETMSVYWSPQSVNAGTLNLTVDPYSTAWAWAWGATDSVIEKDYIILPVVYENLGLAAVRKTLGLSPDQEKQLKEIASNSQIEMEKLSRKLRNLAPEEQQRKMNEYQLESAKLAKEIRQKIEALLTPEQLAALKDNQFRSQAFGWLIIPQVQDKIGLSDRQKADIYHISKDLLEKSDRFDQELFAKELGLLTPGQQEKLREELDRRGW